jgi:hypothetical protein
MIVPFQEPVLLLLQKCRKVRHIRQFGNVLSSGGENFFFDKNRDTGTECDRDAIAWPAVDILLPGLIAEHKPGILHPVIDAVDLE